MVKARGYAGGRGWVPPPHLLTLKTQKRDKNKQREHVFCCGNLLWQCIPIIFLQQHIPSAAILFLSDCFIVNSIHRTRTTENLYFIYLFI